MSQVRNVDDPDIIYDAAAYLFWTLVGDNRHNEVRQLILETRGQCLMEQPFTAAVLNQYGFADLTPVDQRKFGRAIAAEADRSIRMGDDVIGLIYPIDARRGRSPSALRVQTEPLRAIPNRVNMTGGRVEKLGWLCLRHPLPAVVWSHSLPQTSVIEVADTSAALGFNLPMFLTQIGSQQSDDRLFVSAGILYIPVPDERYNKLWSTAIRNSLRFLDREPVFWEEAGATVDVQW